MACPLKGLGGPISARLPGKLPGWLPGGLPRALPEAARLRGGLSRALPGAARLPGALPGRPPRLPVADSGATSALEGACMKGTKLWGAAPCGGIIESESCCGPSCADIITAICARSHTSHVRGAA